MYKGKNVILVIPAFNEQARIGRVVEGAKNAMPDVVVAVVNDSSTDATGANAQAAGAHVLFHDHRRGVGAALRTGLEYGREESFDIAVIMAGNGKDEPLEIPRLLDPIANDESDFVIGSRYLVGGQLAGATPLYRRWATRLHPFLVSSLLRKRLTESTNGFRAFRLGILDDERINLHQRWLDAYGLEVYLLWKVLQLGYRYKEVPCTKTYPPRSAGYTKMMPIIGWWSILRPIFSLRLGLRS
ncbi:MAG: glycosyltransferase family 2 protein [Planctomycetes bacterium]|nr:glycosyltransferase family 2 protein [Planctomycetota bacterium]